MAIVSALLLSPVAARAQEAVTCLPSVLADGGPSARNSALHDLRGRPVTTDRFGGRSVIVTFLPRACDGVCAMRMLDLDRVARGLPPALSGRVAFVLIDTGERSATDLRRMAAGWRLDTRRWTLLHGAAAAARRRLDVAPADAAEPSDLVALFDAAGGLRQRYAGVSLDRQRLLREIPIVDMLSHDRPTLTCFASIPGKPLVRTDHNE